MSNINMAAPSGGASSLHRSATNVYRRLLNFDSPLAVIGLENVVPKGEEKLLKSSFYQAATIFIMTFGLLGVYSLYVILSPFVKPILWAVLIGTVLHPLKLAITRLVSKWLRDIGCSSHVPILTFHVITSPVTMAWCMLTKLQKIVCDHIIPLAAGSFAILLLYLLVRFDFHFISKYLAILPSGVADIWSVMTLPWPFYLTCFLGYGIVAAILPPHYWPPVLLKVMPVVWWVMLFLISFKLLGPLSMLVFPALLIPLLIKTVSVLLKYESLKENVDGERKAQESRPTKLV